MGNVDQASRIDILERFKAGDYYVLINLDILTAGIDVPNVDKIIVTRPFGSEIMYSQVLGRAMRGPRNGGKKSNTVITVKDNLRNYPSANLVYSLFANEWRPETIGETL